MVNFNRSIYWILSVILFTDTTVCVVVRLAANDFDSFVSEHDLVLLLFKSSDECPSCNKALEYFDKIPQPDLVQTEINKRVVTDEGIADRLGIADYPAIVFFRQAYPVIYHGKLSSTDEVPEFLEWLTSAAEVATKDLNDDSFEHLTQASSGATTGDWFVLFFKPYSEDSLKIFPSLEGAAVKLKQRMNFAKIDVDTNKKLVERFKIRKVPYAILFKQGKMYPYEPEKFDAQSIVSFVEAWYKNVKSSPVPKEPTAFDLLTESIALFIKQQVNDPDRKWLFLAGVAFTSLLVVGLIVVVLRKPADNRHKTD